jgi:protein gp37
VGENSKIEWTDHTFNPWTGCQAVSPACDHCYAEALEKRYGHADRWGPHGVRVRTSDANWRLPIRWNKAAAADGVRRKVFCASLADVFDNRVPEQWRADLWALINATPNLDWLLLTKRPHNIHGMLPIMWGDEGWPNVWLGTTAENQEKLAIRAWHLAQVPARVRFLSCEPLLGPIDVRRVTNRWGTIWDALTGFVLDGDSGCPHKVGEIAWVIVGGESGPGARPMRHAWARGLQMQCDTGTAFFMKQMGGPVKSKMPPIPEYLQTKEFPSV